MELDCTVPESTSSAPATAPIQLPEDPYIADLLKIADDNIAKLKAEVELANEEKEALEGKIFNLRKQVNISKYKHDWLTCFRTISVTGCSVSACCYFYNF